MENKEKIIKALKDVLVLTRAGEDISGLVLSKAQDKITIVYKNGHFKSVNIEADSGIAIIKDVIKEL